MANLAEIAGVVIDLDRVPERDEPGESHVRYIDEGLTVNAEGHTVRRAEMVAGPAPTEEQS